jgi:YNFM family putative membrane transporter
LEGLNGINGIRTMHVINTLRLVKPVKPVTSVTEVTSRRALTLVNPKTETQATPVTSPADGRATGTIPWTGLLAVTICGSCAFLNLYATQPLLPLLVNYFHSTQGDVSLTVSATSFGVALAAPFIGKFSDRIGRKKIIIPAIFLLMIPTILAGLTSDVWQLIACRFAQGLILPAIFAVTMAYVAEEWHEYGLGFAMAMYVSGNVVGGFLGRLVSGLVAANFGWRQAFFVLAMLNLIGGLLAWALLPKS